MSGRQADYVAYVEGRLAWLRRLAYLLCQDWHSADDLVQVTVTRLFTHWPRAARMDNTDAYVRTILVRTFLDERRSPWFRRVLLPGVQADRAAVCADPDAVLDVREALAAIPPRQRATLVLRFYCDLDVEQAAIALGCSAGTVKSQTSKGLAALRRMLEPAWGPGSVPHGGGSWMRQACGPCSAGWRTPSRRFPGRGRNLVGGSRNSRDIRHDVVHVRRDRAKNRASMTGSANGRPDRSHLRVSTPGT